MKRKGKIRVIGIAMLAILIITQVCMPVSASNTDELNVSEGAVSLAKEEHINAAPKDDSPAILDSSSVLLPETNTRALASSVDLSTSRYFPPIGNQRNIGNCTSWASVYYQFGYQVASKYDLDVDSTSNLFSPKWVHNMAKNNTGNNGSSYSNVYKILMGNGAVRYSECTPATSSVTDTSTEYLPWYLDEADMTNALKYRISNYETLSFADTAVNTPIAAYNSSNLTNMKTFLSAGNVLTITADMSTWDYKTLSSQSNSSLNGEKVCIKVYDSDDDWQGHALAVVGYNDNITYDLNGNGTIQSFERGAFKIANSWGTSASNHNDGFIWVMYDALNKVSSATNQNVSTRIPAFDNYKYNVIAVKEYPRDVIAKVTLNHSDRTQVKLELGVSSTTATTPTTKLSTMLLQNKLADSKNFSGTGSSSETKTFVFDFGDLYALDTERSNCYICVSDESGGASTIVKEIELIDGTGKTIVLDTADKTVTSTSANYKFKLGIVGDINNDTNITSADATLIQKYVSKMITLTEDELKVADVNGDGKVTTSDATMIQKYIAHTIDEFTNGSVVLLSR